MGNCLINTLENISLFPLIIFFSSINLTGKNFLWGFSIHIISFSLDLFSFLSFGCLEKHSTLFFHTWRPLVKCSYVLFSGLTFLSSCPLYFTMCHLSHHILPLWLFFWTLSNLFRAKSYIKISSYLRWVKTGKAILILRRKLLANSQLKRNMWVTPPLSRFPKPHSNLQTHQSPLD